MKTINNSFYKIEGLLDLIKKCTGLKPRRLWLRRLALLENLNNYYRFSVSSVRLFQEGFWKSSEIPLWDINKEDFNDKSHSCAIAFYSHARVCIESSRLLSEEGVLSSNNEKNADVLQKHRDSYAGWARDIIEKRNGVNAHPHDIRKMITGSPSGWGSNGKVAFTTFDLEHIVFTRDKYKLEPVVDLEKLKKYIEETINQLKSIWLF